MGDPEKIIDLAALQAEAATNQKARREAEANKQADANKRKAAGGYEYAFSQQAERSKQEREEFARTQQKQKPFGGGAKAKEEKADFAGGATIKPKIELSGKTSSNFITTVERTLLHLNDAKAGIYQRGNRLVRLIGEWEKGVKDERVKVWKLVAVTDRRTLPHIIVSLSLPDIVPNRAAPRACCTPLVFRLDASRYPAPEIHRARLNLSTRSMLLAGY